MGEDLGGRSGRGIRRRLGRRTASKQCGADVALAVVETFPDALPGSSAEMGVDGADGGGDAAGDGVLEESPEKVSGEAKPSDFVGEPDAEGSSATGTCIAVAAKDAPCARRFALRIAVVETVQIAVSNQGADHLAVRTRRLLEAFGQDAEFVGAAKPRIPRHVGSMPPGKALILPEGRSAGYDKKSRSEVRGIHQGQVAHRGQGFAKFSV